MAKNANQIRIIAGKHRGRRLGFVPVNGLRPTPDRVRETLFNWLQFDIREANCLDLFAGSGALGLEALSRGAAKVYFVEQNRSAANKLKENLVLCRETAHSEVLQQDARRFLSDYQNQPFDVVFLDPPFAHKLLPEICRNLEQNHLLASTAWVYVEQDAADAWDCFPENWQLHRQSQAGQTAQRLFVRQAGE